MEIKVLRHGTHIPGNDHDGYMYSFNTSKGYNFDSHLHKCYEIIHVIHGNFIYTVEGHEYRISDGDIVITSPDELHSFSFPEECAYQREFLHVYPGFIEKMSEIADMLNSRSPGEFNHIPKDKAEKYGFDKIFDDIRSSCETPTAETDTIIFANVILFAAKMRLMLAGDAPKYPERGAGSKAKTIYGYIDLHYPEDINSASIAAVMAISETTARKIFKKETGMTIKSYLTLRRVTAAKNLIMEGCKAMNIFTQCGFGDYSTFYRSFVKYVGMTPDEFKHRHDDRKQKLTNHALPSYLTEKTL